MKAFRSFYISASGLRTVQVGKLLSFGRHIGQTLELGCRERSGRRSKSDAVSRQTGASGFSHASPGPDQAGQTAFLTVDAGGLGFGQTAVAAIAGGNQIGGHLHQRLSGGQQTGNRHVQIPGLQAQRAASSG